MTTQWAPTLTIPVTPERDHIRGPVNAPVTLVEYGDYQCPFCQAAHEVVAAVQRQMGERLRFAYRHVPLTSIHPQAEQAAEAAEVAGAQGKFWAMHDQLYRGRGRLGQRDLIGYAVAVGLALPAFERQLASHQHYERVREDFISGVRSGVNGTPTFFVNGLRHDGGHDAPTLLAALEHAARTG